MTTVNGADFYVGRGPDASYLGTRELDGEPEEVCPFTVFQSRSSDEYTQDRYAQTVTQLIDTTTWPHQHDDSTSTEWTYCWDNGTVYVYHFGVEAAQIRANTHSWQNHLETLQDGRHVTDSSRKVFRSKRPNRFPRQRWAS